MNYKLEVQSEQYAQVVPNANLSARISRAGAWASITSLTVKVIELLAVLL